jgi:hypothetical protein
MRFKSPIEVNSVSIGDDLPRCLVWSTALSSRRRQRRL